MFIRQGRDKVFVIPAVVYLLVLFLSINIFIGQAVSGKDATLDNLAVISGDSRKPVHQEELPHYRAMDNPRRQRMEGDPHRQDEDARFSLHGRNTEAGRHGPKDTRYPTPEAMSVGESTEATNAATFTWEFETPDAPKYFDLLSSRAITVDASNHPHIAYGGDHLYYAYHDGTTWRYETVDASSIVGDWASLALDTSGHAHISYEDFANRDIRYATNASGSWVTTTVDSTGWVGWTNSIALDVSGHAHISYNDETNEDLKYATNVSGLWVTTTVDSGSVLYFGNSIAIDTTGHAHISYQDGNGLRYATNVSGLWVTTTVDNNGWVGVSTSLALDASGHVHISYRDNTNFVLKYATNASGSWITTTADSDGDVGQYTSWR